MYGLKDKSTDSVNNGIRNIVAEILSYGHRVESIFFDIEAVFNACALYVRERKILPLYTPSGLHNRLIERYTQTINNKVRILEADLPFIMPNIWELRLYSQRKIQLIKPSAINQVRVEHLTS